MKLKKYFNPLVTWKITGLLVFSISLTAGAQSFLTTLKDKFRGSSSSTNSASETSLTNTTQTVTVNTNGVKLDEVAYELDRSRNEKMPTHFVYIDGEKFLDPKNFVQMPLNLYSDFVTSTAQKVYNALRARIEDNEVKTTLEFRGRSTEGHEFKLVITGQTNPPLGPISSAADEDPNQDLTLDLAIYFDGAGPAPVLGRLNPAAPNLSESAASFTGMLLSSISAKTKAVTLDHKSKVVLSLDYDEMVEKFILRGFSLEAPAVAATSIQDSNETIASGGLDSGGGK